jgi:hypothetical protein
MRFLYAFVLTVFLAACATDSGGGSVEGLSAQTTGAWQTAYNSRDPARITAMYDTDAVLWGTTAKSIAPNPAAVAEYFKDAAKRPNARVNFGEDFLRLYGDIAVSTGYYTFSDVNDGKTTSRPARYGMTFRNKGGKWLIVAHHSSVVP